jgi:hypothetical protein
MIAEPRRHAAHAPVARHALAPAGIPAQRVQPATVGRIGAARIVTDRVAGGLVPEQRGPVDHLLFEPPAGLGPWVPPLPEPTAGLSRRTGTALVAAAVVMLLALAGITAYALHTAPTTSVAANALYLAAVRDHSTLTSADATDADLLGVGGEVCSALDDHPSRTGVIGALITLRTTTGWSRADSATVVASAVGAYCPAYADLLD